MKKLFSLLTVVALFSASLFADTYTVSGSGSVFGSNWDPNDANNEMVLVEGSTTVYELVKTDITLSTGNVEFKVVTNHSYDQSYPASNYVLTITKSGKYDITVTFDSESKNVAGKAELKEEVVVIPSVEMKGDWNEWAEALEFTVSNDKKTASATKNFTKGAYQFKVVLSNGSDWRGNGVSVTREANSVTNLTQNTDNMKLMADAPGDYTFTWTYETNTLVVTFPAALDPDALPDVALVGSFNSWNKDANLFVPAEDKLIASVKVTLDAKEDHEFKILIDGMTYLAADGGDSKYGFHREHTSAVVESDAAQNMILNADVAGDYEFTWTYASKTLEIIFPAKEATAISNTTSDVKAVKFMQDGQLYIRANGQVYSILGK